MTLGSGHLDPSLRIATVVVPVAMYFLVLGLLNSRSRPQLLRGRRDFALLLIALGPVFVLPVLHWVQNVWVALAIVAGAGACVMRLLAPPKASWVIYNIAPDEARQRIAEALRAAGLAFAGEGRSLRLADGPGTLRVTDFPLLRNVTVRVLGVGKQQAARFESALARELHGVEAETTPMTMALLLVATAMLAAPLALVAPRVPEIVRLLTGVLY
jgi:hypothetical protein